MALNRDRLQRLRQQPAQQGSNQQGRPQSSLARAYQEAQEPDDGGFFSTAKDVGLDVAQGALRLPGAVTGLADIPIAIAGAGRPFDRISDGIGEATGFRPGEWAESLDQYQSEALKGQQANVEQAFEGTATSITEGRYGDALRGAGRGAMALAANPRALASTVFESVPSMIAGGVAGRGIQALGGMRAASPAIQGSLQAVRSAGTAGTAGAPRVARTLSDVPRISGAAAAGAGEGAVIAGMSMNNMDEDIDDRRAAVASLTAGVGGGLLGYGGGRLAARMGVINPEQVFMGRAGRAGTDLGRGRNLPARVAGGFVSEGLFEEMPQETLETVTANWAEGEPLFNNVPRAAIEGLMAGGVMGGAMNIRRPRGTNIAATDLTDSGQQEERPNVGSGKRAFNPQTGEVADLMRYHRRLAQVATGAVQHPDLQEQAIDRIEGVLTELDRRGIPREVVNEELAKKKYQSLEDQEITMSAKLREATQTNPGVARAYLAKLQGVKQEKQQLEQQYSRQALLGPDFETAQTIKDDPAAASLFSVVKGEKTNRLKPKYQKKLTEFRELAKTDPDRLMRDIAKNWEDADAVGEETSGLNLLREAAARDAGITEEQLREVQRREYGRRETDGVTDDDVSQAFGDGDTNPISDADAETAAGIFAAGSDTEIATRERELSQEQQEAGVSRETPQPGTNVDTVTRRADPRWQVLEQASEKSPAAQDAIWAIGEALGEAEAGVTVGTIRLNAASYFQSRRPDVTNPANSMDRALKRLTKRVQKLSNNPEMEELTTQGIVKNFMRDREAENSIGATEGTQLDGELIGEQGSLRGISSPGGTTNEADVARIKAGIREELNAQINAVGASDNVATATERAEQWVAQNTENMQQETLETLIAEIEAARTARQVSTAMRKARTEILNTLTARQTEAAPPRPKRTPELTERQRQERQRMAQEAQQAAEGRQQAQLEGLLDEETQAEARSILLTPYGLAAGRKWKQRSDAWWDRFVPGSDPLTWQAFADQYTMEAMRWIQSVNEIDTDMQLEPDAKRAALRELFEDFANAIANGTAQQNPEGVRLLSGPAQAANAADTTTGAGQPRLEQPDAGRPGPAVEPEPAAEPNASNPGTEVVESRETQQQRSDRYATDPMAALAELREALEDLAIAAKQEGNSRSDYGKKLTRVQRDANKVFNNISESTPDAVAKAVHDTYELVAPVAADRARDEALAEKARKRAEREERTRKIAPQTFQRDGVTHYVTRSGKGFATEAAANLQRYNKRFRDLGFKPENLEVVELDGLPAEGGRFALRFVPEPSEQARSYSLEMSSREGFEEQTGSSTVVERAQDLEDLMITMEQREQAGDGFSVSELVAAAIPLTENPNLKAWLRKLGTHLRTFTVRVSSEPSLVLGGRPPSGFHSVDSMVVWMNHTHYKRKAFRVIAGMIDNFDPGDNYAEVVAHELLHVATLDATMSLDPNDPLRQELRDIKAALAAYSEALKEDLRLTGRKPTQREDYVLFRLDLMTDNRLQSEGLTHGEVELITYGLTDEVMRNAMANMPGNPLAAREGSRARENLLQRFINWARDLLRERTPALDRAQSMLGRIENVTQQLMEQDEANAFSELTLEDDYTSRLWAYARERASLFEPFVDQRAQRILDQYKPRVDAALQQAEDGWAEVIQARIEGAIIGDEINPDLAARIAEVQRALYDVNLWTSHMEQLINKRFYGRKELRNRILDRGRVSQSTDSRLRARQQSFESFALAQNSNRVAATKTRETAHDWTRKIYQTLPDKVSDAAISTMDGIRKLGMLSMFTSQFVDYAKKWLPTVPQYYDTIRYRISERNSIHTKIQETVGEVSHWEHDRRKQLNKFLSESTYRGKWGFKPDWLPNATVDPDMRRKFLALDGDQRRVAENMFREAHYMHIALQKELRGDIERVYDESISRATQPSRISKLQREKADALAAHDNRQNDFRDAYLPLKRWGKWAVVYKSQAFKDAETRGNRREIDRLKQDEQHYMVAFAESQYAARQLRRQWEEEKGESIEDAFPRMRYDEKNELVPFDLLQRLKQRTAEGTGIPKGVSSKLDEALNRVYIEALSESSVRKSELRRIGVRGYDEDMVRAFVQHGQGVASLTSAIRINWQTRQHIEQMKEEAQNPARGLSRKDTMAALNEILARHALSLEPQEGGIQQRVMGMTSIWMLLTSPAYYIQNATQPFMMTLPRMAARFGFGRSSAHMTRAYKDVSEAWGQTRKDPLKQGDLMDPNRIKDPKEREVVQELLGLNLLDVGIAADLGSLSDARTNTMRKLNRAHQFMVTGVRTVEVFNRGVTALSAYRLARERYDANPRMTEEQSHRNAKAYAIEQVEITQGDYGGQNAPRLINLIPAGRIVTQFRKFQLIQIGLLTRAAHQAFKHADPVERAIGKRHLTYILGVHAAVGGLTGLPAANIISMAVGMAFGFGDEDEPSNVEMRIRREIGDKPMADLILQGLPAWGGIDASNRLGMGLTFSIMPFTDVELSRDGFATMAGSLVFGPTGAVGASALQGMGKWQNGDVFGGVADMLPVGLKNAMRAYSAATEGIETRTGITAISAEELNWFDLASQAAGWPSKTISDRYEMYGMLLETEEFFRNRTGKIKRAYTEAYEEGDSKGMAEARDEWMRLQRSRVDYGVGEVQPLSNLLKAPREKREKEASMIGGVPTERTNRRFVQELWE